MTLSIVFATFAVFLQCEVAFAQDSQLPSKLTAAELWNPYTWFYPYAIAAAEGYRDYYVKAQKATNELYQQIYATNAFPWITGNWGVAPSKPDQNTQNGGPSKSTQKPEETTTQPPKEGQDQPAEDTNDGGNVNAEVQGDDAQANVEADTQDGTVEADVETEDMEPEYSDS